jgi:translocation and assembly module TamB
MSGRARRILWIAAAALGAIGILAIAAAMFVLESPWFHQKVRERMVAEIEKTTGGRAEIGRFQFDWRTLTARVSPFVLHGKEKQGEPPFVEAASIEAGLKIVSALERRVDLALLVVDRPRVRVIVYPDGTTNVPEPKAPRERASIAAELLRLKVGHFELRNGIAEVRERRVPFDIRGDDLAAAFDYDPAGPAYRGHLSSRQLHWQGPEIHPVAFDFDTDLVLDKDQLRIARASFVTGRSRLDASGSLHDWADPRLDLAYDSKVLIAELAGVAALPIERAGEASVRGTAAIGWSHGLRFRADGQMTARGLAYRDARFHFEGIGAHGSFHLTPGGVSLPRVTATALGATFEGRVEAKDRFEKIEVEGEVRDLAIARLNDVMALPRPVAWSGTVSGPVRIAGRIAAGRPRDFTIETTLDVARAPGAIPIDGKVAMTFEQSAARLQFGNSALATPTTRVQFSGTLGESMRANLESKNLADLLPGLAMASSEAPKELPLELVGGAATASVTITGPLASPVIAGHVTAGRFEARGQAFDQFAADVNVSRNELSARNITLAQRGAQVTGNGQLRLRDWRPVDTSALSAALTLRGGDLQHLVEQAGEKLPVSGTLTATSSVSGTYGSPLAALNLTIDHPEAFGETFDQLTADAVVSGTTVQVKTGSVRLGRGRAQFSGSYRLNGQDWKSGAIRFVISGAGFTLDQLRYVREYNTGLSAAVTFEAAGTARVENAAFDLDTLSSKLTLAGMTRFTAPVGNLTATAKTREGLLEAEVNGAIRGSTVHGFGQWKLQGDYPGRGEVQFTPISFAALHEMILQHPVQQELPFVGQLFGQATVTGPLKKPDDLRAEIVLPEIRLASNPSKPLPARSRGQDLVLRNTEPVRLSATLKAVDIHSARFAAADTSIEASGRVTYDAQSPWNVAVKGTVNLAILQLFNSDVRARGNATLDTTIRGALSDPQVNGRLQLRGASLYLEDLPQGVDNANGLVTFDRNRANIQSLTAEVGGGKVSFGGFIGFGNGILLYHVQGSAEAVRVRDPQGLSVTANAQLNLTGTSENGLVSGTITVARAAFEPRADLAGLLAQSTKPLPAPAAPNEYLRGLNFDVRVASAPSLEVQTTLTRNLEAEIEMRLRGNAARPTLAGNISVNQGEIVFLGNKYTINRGDIRFVNPAKIEPVFDVDLETKARGIRVNISFSGTLNKLNVTYRSDPPLQSSDIIALLAVGRDPTIGAFANAQSRSNLLESGANTLSQAVAAPVSSRLQRFFGVSRLKIDPSLVGVDNIPQARLTLEQQVSPDITLTYITNLTRTQEQLVQVQWDINRRWSAVAVREENGVFGIDFQYRKRFK